jgi:hypothetical protein
MLAPECSEAGYISSHGLGFLIHMVGILKGHGKGQVR